MRALIMAAGRGTRISRYIDGKPKCTVNIGDITLIEHTIKQLIENGITEIGICIGYKGQVIKEILKNYDIQYFENPFYDVTNSIASAWFAMDFINHNEDILIMNGDVFIDDNILKRIISETLDPVLYCDKSRKEEADYKFYFEDNILIKYGKELQGNEISGEYIGIARIGKSFINLFIDSLKKLIQEQQHNLWWENALYSLTDQYPIYVRDVEGSFWAEVDYIEDYERILAYRNYKINYNIEVTKC